MKRSCWETPAWSKKPGRQNNQTTQADVIQAYQDPPLKKHIGGKRLSFYILFCLIVCTTLVGFSLFLPQALSPDIELNMEESEINLSLIRRFPFSNIQIPDDQAVSQEKIISVSGKTAPQAQLLLNSNPIETAPNGVFSLEYELDIGANELVFEITKGNKYSSFTRTIYFQPLADEKQPPENDSPQITIDTEDSTPANLETPQENDQGTTPIKKSIVEIHAWPDPISLTITPDQDEPLSIELNPGDQSIHRVIDQITIETSNGAATYIIIDQQNQGVMNPEPVFTKKTYQSF